MELGLGKIIILSAVEGITEFLPVSSTAHLILTSKLLNLPQTPFLKLFEVFIQTGAIAAVLFLYIKLLFKKRRLILNLFISFLPTAFFGLILYKTIKQTLFESYALIAINLIILGFVFLLIERLVKEKKLQLKKELEDMSLYTAFLVGLAQALAVFPGISRAGAVIIALMILGFKRKSAVEYSFLLAIPTIFAAGFFDLYKNLDLLTKSKTYASTLLLGSLLSFIFAYISVKWFLKFLKKNTLVPFGIYRIVVGITFLLKNL